MILLISPKSPESIAFERSPATRSASSAASPSALASSPFSVAAFVSISVTPLAVEPSPATSEAMPPRPELTAVRVWASSSRVGFTSFVNTAPALSSADCAPTIR